MDSLASLYGISFGLNDVNVSVEDVVKIKEVWVSYQERKIIHEFGFFSHEGKAYFAECTVLSLPQCSQSECADVAGSMVTFRNRVVLYWLCTDETDSSIVVW